MLNIMAGKSARDKDLEALCRKISDLEASMDHANDRLDEMDKKLKEKSAVESEHEGKCYACCKCDTETVSVFCEETAAGVLIRKHIHMHSRSCITLSGKTIRNDAGAVSPVVSSDDDEAVAQNKKKTFGEPCKSSSFSSATKSTVRELSCLFIYQCFLLILFVFDFHVC